MSKSSGLTRGDRRRNRRIGFVRQVVRPELAILAIDLGEHRQVAVVMDHDRTVLARRVDNVKAHQLGRLLEWGAKQADGHGFGGVVVGCEPTGHRWRAVMQLADRAGMAFACVQPLLQELHQCLNRAVSRAMARDLVKRNVIGLCEIPKGQSGRPSKSLTLAQARAVLKAAEETEDDYTIVSLVAGARTEEMRALAWDHVDLDGDPDADPPVPACIEVWRSVREGGDTKTRKSRRTLAASQLAVRSLRRQRERQIKQRAGWRTVG